MNVHLHSCSYGYLYSIFYTTSVSQVAIVNPPSYVVDGDQNVELQCTVTLSNTIGTDYSALSIDWRDGTDIIISNCSNPQPHGNIQNSSTFSCNLTLATISATSAGLYTCNAAISTSNSTSLINLQVQGLKMKVTVNQLSYMLYVLQQDLSRVLISSHQRMLLLDNRLCSLVNCTLHYQSPSTQCSQSSGCTEGVWSLVIVDLY